MKGGKIMSRETIKTLIDLVPEEDVEILYELIVKFIPESLPEPDEIEAIEDGRRDMLENGAVADEDVDWN
jgi:hypothetical protein